MTCPFRQLWGKIFSFAGLIDCEWVYRRRGLNAAAPKVMAFRPARNSAQAFTAPVMPLRSCLSSMARTFAGRAIEHRKSALAKLIRGVLDGVAFNQHFTCDGATSCFRGRPGTAADCAKARQARSASADARAADLAPCY